MPACMQATHFPLRMLGGKVSAFRNQGKVQIARMMQVPAISSLESLRKNWWVPIRSIFLGGLNYQHFRVKTFLFLSGYFFPNNSIRLALECFFSEKENVTSANGAEPVRGRTCHPCSVFKCGPFFSVARCGRHT